MSNYTKSTNFATKDNLSPGDPLKIVRGTEIDTEFNNISTAISTKTDNSAAAITGGSITGITDLAIADGGTGASTATAAINNLLPSQTSAANKYLQSDGTNVSWDAVTLSTSDITGTLAVANGGTGVTSSTGTGNVVLSNSPTLVTPALGTPASGVATNLTGLPISTGVSGLGTGVATFLGTPSSANLASAVSDETGTGALVFANSPTLVTPALGTPSALVGTNITGTASGLTAGNVTTNANLTGAVTSVGNASSLGSFTSAQLAGALTDETGTGSAVFATSPTLVTPILGTPTSATLTNATGLPIATGVSGLGTGVATALAVNVGSAGAPVVNGGALGTPSSGTVTNLTGTASININGTVGATTPTTGAFTTVAASSSVTLSGGTANGVTYLNGSKVLTSGSALVFTGTNLGVGTSSPNFESGTGQGIQVNYSGGLGAHIKLTDSASGSGATDGFDLYAYNTNGYVENYEAGAIIFRNNGTEGMRLTSTGLGIGTSSPNAPLSFASSTGQKIRLYNSLSGYGIGVESSEFRFVTDSSAKFTWLNGTYSGGTTQMTLDSAGNLGLGVTPSAGGGVLQLKSGITFPATQSASSDANTLDDYEEGTWTPSLAWSTPGTSSITPTSATAQYTKVGNMVYCAFNFDNATFTNGTASGYLILSGLPFTASSSATSYWGGSITTNIGFPTNMQNVLVDTGAATATFKKSDSSASNVVVADVSGSGKYIRVAFMYRAA